MLDRVRVSSAASSRRRVLRALLGAAAAALAGAGPRISILAHPASEYCADTPEQEFLNLINAYRAANGRGSLSLGQHIGAAAQHHSADMANRNFLSHTTPGTGEGPRERMVAHGYAANTTWWGENIYAGYGVQNGVDLGSAQAAFTWWKNSPGHNANMLNANYRIIGIDRTSNPNSQYRNYWTTDFGGVVDQAATLCGATPPPPSTPAVLTIVGHAQSSNSNSGRYAYDGDPTTAWRSSSVTPSSAWVRLDLGSVRALSEIRWRFSQIGSADQFTIQVSSDGASWQTLATRGNASSAGTWQTLAAGAAARYVRFNFANPNRDRRLGFLSEVQIVGTTSTLRSANIAAHGRSENGARQAGPPAISSEDERAAGPRDKKQQQNRKRRRGGRRRG
jgi:uncharacterized protein YkwD